MDVFPSFSSLISPEVDYEFQIRSLWHDVRLCMYFYLKFSTILEVGFEGTVDPFLKSIKGNFRCSLCYLITSLPFGFLFCSLAKMNSWFGPGKALKMKKKVISWNFSVPTITYLGELYAPFPETIM